MQIFSKLIIFTIIFLLDISNIRPILSNPIEEKNELSEIKTIYSNQISPYILGPGDLIELNFYSNPEYNGQYLILNDGTISLPFIGSIYVEGNTLDEANDLIEVKLSEEFINPKIYLRMINTRAIGVSIVGEVTRPGYYQLTKNNGNILGLPTVVDALKEAGGINIYSDLEDVELIRKLPSTNDKIFKKTNLNLMKLIFEGEQKHNLLLHDGDVLKISKRKEPIYKNFDKARANLSPNRILVYVVGEVKNPGPIEINSNTTISQAISSAGGILPNRGNYMIDLYRIEGDGKGIYKKLKLKRKEGLSSDNNPILFPGDIIKVNRKISAIAGDIIKPITSPLVDIFTIFRIIDISN